MRIPNARSQSLNPKARPSLLPIPTATTSDPFSASDRRSIKSLSNKAFISYFSFHYVTSKSTASFAEAPPRAERRSSRSSALSAPPSTKAQTTSRGTASCG